MQDRGCQVVPHFGMMTHLSVSTGHMQITLLIVYVVITKLSNSVKISDISYERKQVNQDDFYETQL